MPPTHVFNNNNNSNNNRSKDMDNNQKNTDSTMLGAKSYTTNIALEISIPCSKTPQSDPLYVFL